MSLKDFDLHIKAKAPAFRCYACRDNTEKLDLLAPLVNELHPPASKHSLAKIEKILGEYAKPFVQLYGLHNGFSLYRDSRSDTTGITFFPVEDWENKTNEMLEELDAMGWEDDQYPPWLQQNSIAFAEIPQSANYFVVGTKKPYLGQIFYQIHDDYEEGPLARNLEDFLAMIYTDPPDFLNERGCYTRYSDGKTKIQWIPKEYVADASAKK